MHNFVYFSLVENKVHFTDKMHMNLRVGILFIFEASTSSEMFESHSLFVNCYNIISPFTLNTHTN